MFCRYVALCLLLMVCSCSDSSDNGKSDARVQEDGAQMDGTPGDSAQGDGTPGDSAQGDGTPGDGGETPTAWGWIAVIERQGSGGFFNTEVSGVQAHFAKEPHFRRSLPHHVDQFLAQDAQQGDCTLYVPYSEFSMCNPPCNENQECVEQGAGNFVCEMMGGIYDVGTITVSGLKAAVTLEPDAYKRYISSGLPDDLFDKGDQVQASVAGGELAPMSLQASGVADLALTTTTVELVQGQPATITWTPADANARVQVVLRAGIHYPSEPAIALVCDVEDGAGQVEIPASLVDGFYAGAFVNQQLSWVTRYSREVQSPFGKEIELFVGSSQEIAVSKL